MLKKVSAILFSAVAFALLASPALALDQEKKETPEEKADRKETEQKKHEEQKSAKTYVGFALALGLGIAAFGGAMGQGRAVAGAVDAVARQPEAGGRIQGMMIIGLALIETLVIYMLLICFMWGGQLG
jgi:F-type H+-transporting ATPase subunit c